MTYDCPPTARGGQASAIDELPEPGLASVFLPERVEELRMRREVPIIIDTRIARLTLRQVAGGVAVSLGLGPIQRIL